MYLLRMKFVLVISAEITIHYTEEQGKQETI